MSLMLSSLSALPLRPQAYRLIALALSIRELIRGVVNQGARLIPLEFSRTREGLHMNAGADDLQLQEQVWLQDDSGEWGQYQVVCVKGEWIPDEKTWWEALPASERVVAPIIGRSVGGFARRYRAVGSGGYIDGDRASELMLLAINWRALSSARAGATFEEFFADKGLTELELLFVQYQLSV
jgi:hypothetical protein